MTQQSRAGKPWTELEIELIVADYFDMLGKELAGQAFVKADHKRRLAEAMPTGRDWTSLDPKYQNISAVLERLGFPTIDGFKPRENFQEELFRGVDRYLTRCADPILDSSRGTDFTPDEAALHFEQPPELHIPSKEATTGALGRLIRKFDPALRDERNRKLGRQGEERVLHFERNRLTACGRQDLAKEVCWVSNDLGDGAGYDILSFDAQGRERYLEVKTTLGYKATPFYLTRNELQFSEEKPEEYSIIRLYDFARTARAFELKPPLNESVTLNPLVYQATFG